MHTLSLHDALPIYSRRGQLPGHDLSTGRNTKRQAINQYFLPVQFTSCMHDQVMQCWRVVSMTKSYYGSSMNLLKREKTTPSYYVRHFMHYVTMYKKGWSKHFMDTMMRLHLLYWSIWYMTWIILILCYYCLFSPFLCIK